MVVSQVADQRIEKLADVLTEHSLPVERGQTAVVEGSTVAEPLLLAIYERLLRRGALVTLRPILPHAQTAFYANASQHQLDHLPEVDRLIYDRFDTRFAVFSDVNTKQLSRVDPARIAAVARAREPLLETMMRRTAEGSFRWNLTQYPTEAFAADAGMSLRDYEDFYYRACLVDQDDPVAAWRDLKDRQARVIAWLAGRSEVHLEGEGTDLWLDVGGREFVAGDGHHNLPDGEVFTGPAEDRTRGVVSFSYPAIWNGKSVEGIQLVFEEGRVASATARTNQDFLREMLRADHGASVLGELGIGTNYGISEFTGSILLDEKIGGTIHLALGRAYPETGGRNESAIHWDMVCDLRRGGRITVDGETLMEDGRLLV